MTLSEAAVEAWTVGLEFLAEAESRPPQATPHMAIHAAYYAMFHCARAVLIGKDGLTAPTKQAAVANRFGYYANQSGDLDRQSHSRMLQTVLDGRMRSDYGKGPRPTAADAIQAVQSARHFVEDCATWEGFAPQPPFASQGP